MSATMATRNRFQYRFTRDDIVEVEYPPVATIGLHLSAAAPTAWVWCLNCERAFQIGAARSGRSGVACGYGDCAGRPFDFWSWDAYRAFAGAAPSIPEAERRYPLAA